MIKPGPELERIMAIPGSRTDCSLPHRICLIVQKKISYCAYVYACPNAAPEWLPLQLESAWLSSANVYGLGTTALIPYSL